MDDRLPKILLIGLVALTGIVVVISGLGLFDDALPVAGYESEAKPTTRPNPTPRRDGADEETASVGTVGESSSPTAPRDTRVMIRWRLIAAARVPPSPADLAPLVAEGLVPLPTLHGRIVIKSSEDTGGVRDISVVAGEPLSFTAKVSRADSSVFEYKGEGRDARIVSIALHNGESVQRWLGASQLGPTASIVRIARLGRCRGRVIDADGQGVAGAIVRIDTQSTTTADDGRFVFESIRGGEPILSVTANGFAAHREPTETARRFGADDAPEFVPEIRLAPGRRITIRSRSEDLVSGQVTWHLLPFGYQLQNPHLAVEAMTDLPATVGDALVIEHAPTTQPLLLVGVHPRLNHVYRKVPDGSEDIELAFVLTPHRRLTGRVTGESNGAPLKAFTVESSLDSLTTGAYLGAIAKIPTGHRVCNFPLPSLGTPIAGPVAVDGRGGFAIAYDRGASLKLRVSAPGFASHTTLAPREDTIDVALPPAQTAAPGTVRLSVSLGGNPRVTGVEHRGITVADDYDTEPGRITQELTAVAPGHYELTIESPGYENYVYTIRLDPGGKRRVAVFLTQSEKR